MGPQGCHQNRRFSSNVVLYRRTHESSRREKEGGKDPVRERVNYVVRNILSCNNVTFYLPPKVFSQTIANFNLTTLIFKSLFLSLYFIFQENFNHIFSAVVNIVN